MEKYKKTEHGVEKDREYEQMLADNNQLKADLLYIAMMADIDLDEGESEAAE